MTKYYRYTLKGSHSPDMVNSTLGAVAAHGLVVRVDIGDKVTHVIMAADAAPHASVKLAASVKAEEEVPEAEVLRLP